MFSMTKIKAVNGAGKAFCKFFKKSHSSAVVYAYCAERNNDYFFEKEGRQTAFMQLIFSLSRVTLTLSGKGEVRKQKLPPHFFAQNLGKKT